MAPAAQTDHDTGLNLDAVCALDPDGQRHARGVAPTRKRWKTRIELADAIFDYLVISHVIPHFNCATPIGLNFHTSPLDPWPETRYGDAAEHGHVRVCIRTRAVQLPRAR